MYTYEWDSETGGILLLNTQSQFSKEPRPVYYRELDTLGFDRYWNYDKDDTAPYMWAEASNYFYFGRLVAKTKGGSLYQKPALEIIEAPEPDNGKLRQVDLIRMREKNAEILETVVQSTLKMIYNTYIDFRDKVDVFYVAFSGGKDSVVALDLVQRILPHDEICVLFGDTGMESSDTYQLVEKQKAICIENGVRFYRSHSRQSIEETWREFGPPSVSNRWCCSVHKTTPQILLLREITGNAGFKGMAFTGVRGDESVARSAYDDISFGEKHNGQYSCHPILHWSSAELFLYIYSNDLLLNEAYKKGNSRVGCLVCPMSSGRHEYMKHHCYGDDVERFVGYIARTSGKTHFSDEEMHQFIDDGNWKKRKTGRELNFGQDLHYIEKKDGVECIVVKFVPPRWKEWVKTIGELNQLDDNRYSVVYKGFEYLIEIEKREHDWAFLFPNSANRKDDIKFRSLFRAVIIKSLYCVNCGVCIAECSHGCIDMSSGGVHISNSCVHCHQCHDVHEHCVRYNSIRNKIGGEKAVTGIDRYYSFGIRGAWMEEYFDQNGDEEYWMNTTLGIKMIPAFGHFLEDSKVAESANRKLDGKKVDCYRITDFGMKMLSLGVHSTSMWALLLCNLVYTPEIGWYHSNVQKGDTVTPTELKDMLSIAMPNDFRGAGKRNVVDALKFILITTPLGKKIGMGDCVYTEKENRNGVKQYSLTSITRTEWIDPDPRVILYSLFLLAEKCGAYHRFTLSWLMNEEVERDGISPAQIFGIGYDTMKSLLIVMAANYPDYINVSFTHDLDNINLNSVMTSADVLKLF